MEITSSQSTSSSPSISRASSPSPTLPISQETESNTEKSQLSNQHRQGFVVDAGQPSNQSDISSATRVGRNPQVDTISQQLEKIKGHIPSRLDSIATNLSRISGRLDQLEPKFLTIALPVCAASLSFWLYATNTFQTFQGKPNHQSEPLLDNLLKQINQFEQVNDSMPNRLDFLEAELGRLSTLLNQSNPQSSHHAFSACVFSIFLCFCVISTLWKKLNSQSIQNKELEKQLIQFKNEKADLAIEFSNQSALSKDQLSKLQELEQQLSQLTNEKTDLAIEYSNQSEQIQTLQNEFKALPTRFHLKSENLPWAKLTGVPTTLRGFGITDAAPLGSPAFVGIPTATTHNEARNNSIRVATTAFTQNAILAAFTGSDRQSFDGIRYHLSAKEQKEEWRSSTLGRGYQKLPGGLILQWGAITSNSDGMCKVTFPVKFLTECMGIFGTHIGTKNVTFIELLGSRSNLGVTLRGIDGSGHTHEDLLVQWFALGC